MAYKAYFDGASEGNPGPSGIGGAVFDLNGGLIFQISKDIGTNTSNEAEYKALISLVEKILLVGIKEEVVIYGDSQLVINQVKGNWKINYGHLQKLNNKLKKLLDNVSKWQLEWIPREENTIADELSKKAINGKSNLPRKTFTGKIEQVEEFVYLAYSNQSGKVYAVDTYAQACSCPAFQLGKTRPCKHLVACSQEKR